MEDNIFDSLTQEELDIHLRIKSYNGFVLTEAIRPSYDVKVCPKEGYTYRKQTMLVSVSEEKLYKTFIDLIKTFDDAINLMLVNVDSQSMYLRQQIDKLVLLKVLDDYKEILLNHGFMAIVLLQEDIKEVSLDDHKIIVVRDINFKNYENVLSNNHILYDSNLQFITDAEHVHISTDEYFLKFGKLVKRIDAEKIKCS